MPRGVYDRSKTKAQREAEKAAKATGKPGRKPGRKPKAAVETATKRGPRASHSMDVETQFRILRDNLTTLNALHSSGGPYVSEELRTEIETEIQTLVALRRQAFSKVYSDVQEDEVEEESDNGQSTTSGVPLPSNPVIPVPAQSLS